MYWASVFVAPPSVWHFNALVISEAFYAVVKLYSTVFQSRLNCDDITLRFVERRLMLLDVCITLMLGVCTRGLQYPVCSLAPRPLPAFECCTLKSGKARFAKSREMCHYWSEKLNVGGEKHKHSRIERNDLFFNKLSKKGHSRTYFNRSLVTLLLFLSRREFLCVRKR